MDEELENEDLDEEEDDSVMGENWAELNDDEKKMLEMAEAEDGVEEQDIENIAETIGKKR